MLSKDNDKHVSNNPVTFVTHEHFAVLFFLPSCCVNSLRSLLSQRLQGKTPLCGPFFENLHFWCRNALNGEKKLSAFRTIKIRVDGHLIKQVPSLFFFCAWLRSWQHGGSDELANGRPATGKRHRNLICHCVSLPTPRPFWLGYRRFIFPVRNNRVHGNVCHKATL